jgi:hypothetical protein
LDLHGGRIGGDDWSGFRLNSDGFNGRKSLVRQS